MKRFTLNLSYCELPGRKIIPLKLSGFGLQLVIDKSSMTDLDYECALEKFTPELSLMDLPLNSILTRIE